MIMDMSYIILCHILFYAVDKLPAGLEPQAFQAVSVECLTLYPLISRSSWGMLERLKACLGYTESEHERDGGGLFGLIK